MTGARQQLTILDDQGPYRWIWVGGTQSFPRLGQGDPHPVFIPLEFGIHGN
jgi:hypothetical protein